MASLRKVCYNYGRQPSPKFGDWLGKKAIPSGNASNQANSKEKGERNDFSNWQTESGVGQCSDPDWTGISPSLWLILISILIGAFIVIDIILYITPQFFVKDPISTQQMNLVEFPEIEERHGKKVYEYTYPVGSKGGIFSKTYIQIGEYTLLRIRNQILQKEQIWKK